MNITIEMTQSLNIMIKHHDETASKNKSIHVIVGNMQVTHQRSKLSLSSAPWSPESLPKLMTEHNLSISHLVCQMGSFSAHLRQHQHQTSTYCKSCCTVCLWILTGLTTHKGLFLAIQERVLWWANSLAPDDSMTWIRTRHWFTYNIDQFSQSRTTWFI